jgi:hypothetical protein
MPGARTGRDLFQDHDRILGTIFSSRCQISRVCRTLMRYELMSPLMRAAANCCFGRAGKPDWWSQTGSNRRPPACKAGALPAELWPRCQVRLACQPKLAESAQASLFKLRRATFARYRERRLVGLGRFELPTSRLSSARSNQLSYKPVIPCEDHPLGPAASSPTASAGDDAGTRTRQNTARGSSMKKEKRRRRRPASGTR